MIYPTASDVLRCVLSTLEESVIPSLRGTPDASAAQTMSHLLRHVRNRIEFEGQSFFDEVLELENLMLSLADYFESLDALTEARIEAARLRDALRDREIDERAYPTLGKTGALVCRLREGVYSSLKFLQSMPVSYRQSLEYRQIRRAIRDYIRWQLDEQ